MRKFAISDVHGCNKTFNEALENIGLNKDDQLFLLGDYIDRGPDSKGVIDTIFKLREDGYHVECLLGNHEKMLLEALKRCDFSYTRRWLIHGGAQTVDSFGGLSIDKLGTKYRSFFSSLPYHTISDDFILVHAGLNFDTNEDPMSLDHSKIWIRNWYPSIDYKWLDQKIIIHGHTPREKDEIIRMNDDIEFMRYQDIDAGCCYRNVRGLGHLCVMELDSRKLFFQKNLD